MKDINTKESKEKEENPKDAENPKPNEEIPLQEIKTEFYDDDLLKDHYSLDDDSFSEENSLPLKKKRKMQELS